MCGIAGVLRAGLRGYSPAGAQAVECMVRHLRHRGPDGCGIETFATPGRPLVGLGHTRLAIIDLSAAGHQPMQIGDANKRLSVTFNGEIYNYASLRDTLGPADWNSHTDTEVLLRAYSKWGRAAVERLRGMFAFAMWDSAHQELFLARDRLGIKPLYYFAADGLFVFASEVRALVASGLVPRRIDPVALGQYLAYQSVPAPRTLIEGVKALPPGCWLVVDRHGRLTQHRYWDQLQRAEPEARQANFADARQRVAELLRESVELHLVSDVPVGAFLSGGIDSSAIVALMRQIGHRAHTFSVAFSEAAYDETHYARRIATQFQTEHTEILLHERDLLDQLPGALAAMDQPTGDGVNTYILARAVRGSGISVALSGLGGDELFAGYPSFGRLERTAQLFRTWGHAPTPVRAIAANAVRSLGGSSVVASKASAMIATEGQLAHLYPVTRRVLSSEQLVSLLKPEWSHELASQPDPYIGLLEAAYRENPRAGVLTSISYAEGRTYMHDVLLRDTDQMSMAHALEVRVPFLDHKLVEYVMGVADAHKQPRGTAKRLLVESLDGLLPREIVDRPKQGFHFPFDEWMRHDLWQFCDDHLGSRGLAGRGIFQPNRVQALWSDFLGRRAHTSWSRIWILVVLEHWLQHNGF